MNAAGTKVNGKALAPNETTVLKGGEVITVVERSFRYEASSWMIQEVVVQKQETVEAVERVKTPVPQESPSLRRSESPRRILAPEFTVNPADIPMMPVHSPSRDWVVHDGVIGQKSPAKMPSSPSRFTITPTKRLFQPETAASALVEEANFEKETTVDNMDAFADLTPIAVISPKKPKLISGLATPLPPSRLAQSTRFSSPNSPATPMHPMQVDREIVASPRLAMSPTLLIGSPLKATEEPETAEDQAVIAQEPNGNIMQEQAEEETGGIVHVQEEETDGIVHMQEEETDGIVHMQEEETDGIVHMQEVVQEETVEILHERQVVQEQTDKVVQEEAVREETQEVAQDAPQDFVQDDVQNENAQEQLKDHQANEKVALEDASETVETVAVVQEETLLNEPAVEASIAAEYEEEVKANLEGIKVALYSDARTLELSQGTELALQEDVCMAEPHGSDLEFEREAADPFAEVCEMAKESLLLQVEELKPAEAEQMEKGGKVTLPTAVEEDAATVALLEAQQSVAGNGDSVLTGIIEKASSAVVELETTAVSVVEEEAKDEKHATESEQVAEIEEPQEPKPIEEPQEPKPIEEPQEPTPGTGTPNIAAESSGTQTPRRSTRLATLQSATKSPAPTIKSSARPTKRKVEEEPAPASVPAKRSSARARTPATTIKKEAAASEKVTRAKATISSPPQQAKSTGRKTATKKKAEVSSSADDMTSPSNVPTRGRAPRSTSAALKTAPVQVVDKENENQGEVNAVRRSSRITK